MISSYGEVSEWLKEHAWKACVLVTVPWVRIPPSPSFIMRNEIQQNVWSGSLTMETCEPCQGRKAAALSSNFYVFRISRAPFLNRLNPEQIHNLKRKGQEPCTWL